MKKTRCLLPVHLLIAGALASGCASTPEGPSEATITDEVSLEAAVVAIDRASRELTIERPDGVRMTFVAGPEVRNFDQIALNDTIEARYVVSLSARRLAADEPGTPPTAEVAAARAAYGARPAGAIGAGMAMTVVVNTVDRDRHEVVFTDPDGMLHTVQAEREEGRRFVEGLAPGDRVELVYTEAAVLAVE
jgi:hypothetical protein